MCDKHNSLTDFFDNLFPTPGTTEPNVPSTGDQGEEPPTTTEPNTQQGPAAGNNGNANGNNNGNGNPNNNGNGNGNNP